MSDAVRIPCAALERDVYDISSDSIVRATITGYWAAIVPGNHPLATTIGLQIAENQFLILVPDYKA